MKIKLEHFRVPNFVIEKLGPKTDECIPRSFPLREVEAGILSKMCDEFRAAVFTKARVADPKASK